MRDSQTRGIMLMSFGIALLFYSYLTHDATASFIAYSDIILSFLFVGIKD